MPSKTTQVTALEGVPGATAQSGRRAERLRHPGHARPTTGARSRTRTR
ncbi:hypothetical protein ACU686_29195 [Yinghuangia aomiensis]